MVSTIIPALKREEHIMQRMLILILVGLMSVMAQAAEIIV